jgi:sugar lactone lactonase YvrE
VLQEFINEESELKDFKGGAVGLTISPDGTRFYASGAKSRSLACFDRDPVNGKLSYVATLKSPVTGNNEKRAENLGANGIAFSSDGRFLYLALEDGGTISVLERTALQPRP